MGQQVSVSVDHRLSKMPARVEAIQIGDNTLLFVERFLCFSFHKHAPFPFPI